MLGLSCVDKVSLVVWAPIKKQKWGIWKFYGNLTNQQDDGCFSGLPVGVLAGHRDRNPVDAHLPRFHSGAAASAGYWKTGLSGFSLTQDVTFLDCFCLASTGMPCIYSRPAANSRTTARSQPKHENCRATLNWGHGSGQSSPMFTSSKERGGSLGRQRWNMAGKVSAHEFNVNFSQKRPVWAVQTLGPYF